MRLTGLITSGRSLGVCRCTTPLWEEGPRRRKRTIISEIWGSTFLTSRPRTWNPALEEIYEGINMLLAKMPNNTNKASFKASIEKADPPPTESYECGGDQAGTSRGDYSRLSGIQYIKFWYDTPRTLLEPAQNRLNRKKEMRRSQLDRIPVAGTPRDEMASDTQEYPSLQMTLLSNTHCVMGIPQGRGLPLYVKCCKEEDGGDEEDGDGDDIVIVPTRRCGRLSWERIPYETSPASIPERQVTGNTFPQRHVAGENPDMSPGKRAIVVVLVTTT
ncbi:hypothetical protein Tco_0894996 [Tanacetum coccineum]|uniref:Uncharacterized protein n=1 Tax=Tanacetum coccineum TaxID=301880 RepID=A0ABQ5CJL2_9ASTR